jgi:hypothetical protein
MRIDLDSLCALCTSNIGSHRAQALFRKIFPSREIVAHAIAPMP